MVDNKTPPPHEPQGETARNFGQRLRELRDRRGWTQDHLAERARCSQGQISRMEKAETAADAKVRPTTVALVAEALGAKPLELEPDRDFWAGNEQLLEPPDPGEPWAHLVKDIQAAKYFRKGAAPTEPAPRRGPVSLAEGRRIAIARMRDALDRALTAAFDPQQHKASDVRDVFEMIEPHLRSVEVDYLEAPDDLQRACRRWLDASVSMRAKRLSLTLIDALFIISMASIEDQQR